MDKKPPENVNLINRAFSLFVDNINVLRNWGLYFLSPEFANEPELRSRTGVVWLVSLLDSLEGEQRLVNQSLQTAADRNLPHFVHAFTLASRYVDTIKEILALYTRDEQFYLRDYRDQLVHGWLARRHRSTDQTVKYFDGTEIVALRIPPQEFANAVYHFYDNPLAAKLNLIERYKNFRLRYWHVIAELAPAGRLEQLHRDLIDGRNIRIVALTDPVAGEATITFRPPRRVPAR